MNQTLVISKCNDKFKIVIHNDFTHTEIYKTKEEVQSIINYMQNTINKEWEQWDYYKDRDDYIRDKTKKEVKELVESFVNKKVKVEINS